MRAKELAVVTSTDCTLVVSDAERKLLNELCPGARVEVVNLPREIPGRSKPYEARRNIAFLGGFQHPPNVDAVFHLAREIWPRVRQRMPGVVLEVFGSNVPPFLHELSCSDIHIRGHIEDLDDIFSSCRLSVAPLRYGAGVKGKIVTSLSYGVPCVATPVAAEGMGLTDGQDILVAETPAAFAEAIAKAYASAELWLSLSEGGLRLVRERFSIEAVAERLRAVLQTLCPATS